MSKEVSLAETPNVPIGQRIVHIELGDTTLALRWDPAAAGFEAAIAYPGPFGRLQVSPKTTFRLAALLGNMGVTIEDCQEALDAWQRETGGTTGLEWEVTS